MIENPPEFFTKEDKEKFNSLLPKNVRILRQLRNPASRHAICRDREIRVYTPYKTVIDRGYVMVDGKRCAGTIEEIGPYTFFNELTVFNNAYIDLDPDYKELKLFCIKTTDKRAYVHINDDDPMLEYMRNIK